MMWAKKAMWQDMAWPTYFKVVNMCVIIVTKLAYFFWERIQQLENAMPIHDWKFDAQAIWRPPWTNWW